MTPKTLTFNEWWLQFCDEWNRLGIGPEYRAPKEEFFDYFEDGDDPRDAALDEISHIDDFQEPRMNAVAAGPNMVRIMWLH
jgi:hypothetical protein